MKNTIIKFSLLYLFIGITIFTFSRCTDALPPMEENPLPDAPTLTYPADEATKISTVINLEWSDKKHVQFHILQVATDPEFKTLIYNKDSITTSTFNISGLADTTKYYWRMASRNEYGPSVFSSVYSFTTYIAPPAPTLVSPPDKVVNLIPTDITFEWNSSNATYYLLQIATDSLFSNIVREATTSQTWIRDIPDLTWCTTYYWRVLKMFNSVPTKWSKVRSFRTFNLISPKDLVQIPGGTFKMGDVYNDGESDEKPTHNVTLSGFRIGRTEVTVSQWNIVMNGNIVDSNTVGRKPINNVSWNDAITFCNNLSRMWKLTPCYTVNSSGVVTWTSNSGFRLPTEAEWEYAARGGSTGTKYPGTNDLASISNYCWNFQNAAEPQPVAQKLPNAFGLYDMGGNVMESVWDIYGTYPSAAQSDPTGPSSTSKGNHVVRGGAYDCDPYLMRTCERHNIWYTSYYVSSGFRIVINK